MLKIEFEEPTESRCECCGNTTIRLTRYVYKDNNAFAVYYASFTKGHPEKRLSGIIGLGEWGDDSLASEHRVAFPFQIWLKEDNFQVGLIDKEKSPWSHVTFLGKILDRESALSHKWISDVFHITDHMVVDDKEIADFFE
ncbi:hypothetical protein Undi14_09765 [Undibacterium sp. 14-3-2]|uniref:hypothetical protein n=1 Tax=Undibacterium sp. 14-3-2 TaxID=2800129 RepID=UPI001902FA6D|nr:hypothetical protein [Undibacterium sp. 14-3-2]MBK1890328.1 hypothetical protein [Undibacterium sp. 14-3-2]